MVTAAARKQSGYPGMMLYTPSEPANWANLPRTVQDALDELADGQGGESLGEQFVWQPGAVRGGNVYSTWASLAAALASVEGQKYVTVDTSLGDAHITTGTWTGITDVHFVSGLQTAEAVVNLDNGAHFATGPGNTEKLYLEGIEFLNFATTSAFMSLTGTQGLLIVMALAAEVAQDGSATKPLVDVGGTASLAVLAQLGVANSVGCFNCSAVGATLIFTFLGGSTLVANAVQQTAVGTFDLSYDDASQSFVSTTQGLTIATLTFVGGSNLVQATGNTGTGAGTVTVTTGNIKKQRTGKVLVTATISGQQGTGGDVVTAQLVRDAGTNIGSPAACTPLSNGDSFALAVTFVDTLPDTANHTYKLSVTGGGGNLTVAATSAQISAIEL